MIDIKKFRLRQKYWIIFIYWRIWSPPELGILIYGPWGSQRSVRKSLNSMESVKGTRQATRAFCSIVYWWMIRYCEQKRLEIMNAKGPAKFKLEFRIIRQNSGAIHKMRVLVQRVEDEEGNLIGLRGAEMDLGIVEEDEPLRWSSKCLSKPRALAKSPNFFPAFKT